MSTAPMGRHHPRLAEIRRALRRGELTSDGLLPVEGPHLVEEACEADLDITDLFVLEGASSPVSADRVHHLSESTLRSISATRTPQGVLALVRLRTWDLDALLSGRRGVWIVLCGVQDPGNAGTILRLADAFGAAGCIRAPGTVSLHNDKLVRASAGSVFRLPSTSVEDLEIACRTMRARGISILGTDSRAVRSLEECPLNRPTAVLFGPEGRGLGGSDRALCDVTVRIPHAKHVDSLNVASAAAILLWEAARHRKS